jgi:group I intron endonuclease
MKNQVLLQKINLTFKINNTYKNLHLNSSLTLLRSELINKSGVYAIVHNESYKMYIGSSNNLLNRLLEHLKGHNSNIYLQNAISKYKIENFTIYILEFVTEDQIKEFTKEELGKFIIEMEQKYIDMFTDLYNINPYAGKTRLGSKHSEETKELMSKLRKENPSFLNKTHSPEVIKMLRDKFTGKNNPMYGKPVTEEVKNIISKIWSKPVYLYDAQTLELIAKYDQQKSLIEDLKISTKTIIKYKDSGEVFRGKYIISSKEISSK